MTIATMRAALTQDDIRRLVRGDNPDDRAQAAQKICRRIDTMELSPGDRDYAQQILSVLAADAAETVRRTLAVTLKASPNLPRDVALKLARDTEAVALPLLKSSPVFTDEDLVELVRAGTPQKQTAIAGRETLSSNVVEFIVENACPEAVETAALNEGASFSERAYSSVLTRYEDSDRIKAALISREKLPPNVTEKLLTMVTGELFDRLVNTHELPPQLAIEIAIGARERATLDLVEQAGMSSDPARFVQQLNLNGRLTPSLIMRAMCLGHMNFVEWGLAELAGVARSKAWLMVHDAGALGMKTIFERAGMPQGMFTAFKLAVDVFHQTMLDGGPGDRQRFRARMVERVLTQFQAIPKADLDYLLEKLDATSEKRGRMAEQEAEAAADVAADAA